MTDLYHEVIGSKISRFQVEGIKSILSDSVEFLCADSGSGYRYSIRLPRERLATTDTSQWENASIESSRAEQIWRQRTQRPDPSLPDIFAVTEAQRLVPASNPYLLKHAVRIDELDELAPSNDLLYFSLWETIALQMMSEAHEVDRRRMEESEWNKRWASLAGGKISTDAITSYLEQGDLSRTERLRVVNRISKKVSDGPELAENVLLRLCGAYQRRRIVPEQFMLTLVCETFRRSVTAHEVGQIGIARRALAAGLSAFNPEDDDFKMLTTLDVSGRQAPLRYSDAPDEFISRKHADLANCRLYVEAI